MDNHEIASKLRDWHLAGGLSGVLDQDELDLLWAAQAALAASGTDALPNSVRNPPEGALIREVFQPGTEPTREQIVDCIDPPNYVLTEDAERIADDILALFRAPSETKP